MKKIIHHLHIKAVPSAVYAALTTRDGLAGWWSRQVEVESGLGGVIDFTFLGDFHPDMQVTRLDQDARVDWKCIGGHDNWADNAFSFRLVEVDGETDLHFVQDYAQELNDEVYGTYNYNWGFYLLSLKKLCETGTGTPFDPSTA